MNYNEFEKLNLADLIAIESYMEKRGDYWNNQINLESNEVHIKEYKDRQNTCMLMKDHTQLEISNRINKIYSEKETEF